MNIYKQNEQWQQNLTALAAQQALDTEWIEEQRKEEAEVMAELSDRSDTWTKHFRYNPEFPVPKHMRIFVPKTYRQ